jgi:Na+-transporting NADH:ubiquinone oxidoreductase subunit A
LTGRLISHNSFVGLYDTLITVIPEGRKKRNLLGYFLPGFKTESYSKTFFSALIPGKKEYELDTLLKGGKRAFVMSSTDYQNVLPMDILPVQLVKSIMAEDIVEMEGLGILELEEEDLALCSYVCLSKTDFGQILRNGLDLIQKEG